MEDGGLHAGRSLQRPRRRPDRRSTELGAALARSGLRAGCDRRRGDRRNVALRRRGDDPRDGHRRVHHQHAHERAAHHVGPAGVADRRHRRHRHHRGLSRHRPAAASGMSGSKITALEALDVRFPTSRTLAGSDAMNTAPDYSATYVILSTDRGDRLAGHGLTFTIGRGNEVVVAAANALCPLIVGQTLEAIARDMGAFWRHMTGDSQLRWIGPDKGAIHLATAAVVNAVWDLWAKAEKKPVWKLLVDMTPADIVRCVDFRYITDAITPDEALEILRRLEPTKREREAEMRRTGFPAYTTSAGWLGYSDEKIRALSRDAVQQGWSHVKMKVGRDIEDDVRRARIIRDEIGGKRKLMMDANQVWDVGEAIANTKRLAQFDPYWMEEPTSPDDVLGHAAIAKAIAPIRVATGEHCQNRVIFKQLLQAKAIGFCQIDACRLGGVN